METLKKICKKGYKCRTNSCCIGITLDDGVHGIVVWDSLYALFVITTTVSVLVQQI